MNKKTIIIIPFILPWDWSADYQRQTCLELAKTHNVIAYMQKDAIFVFKALIRGKKQYPIQKNITFYQPLYFLPFRRISLIEKLNRLLSFIVFQFFTLRSTNVLLWVFDPECWSFVYTCLGKSLYDCVDYAWSRNFSSLKRIKKQERLMLKYATFFIVNSHTLYELHKHLRKADLIAPLGFRLEEFRKNKQKNNFSFSTNKPIIGYIGAINHRINFPLLLSLVKQNPQWTFVFWGRIQETENSDFIATTRWINRLKREQNVIVGHSEETTEISNVISQYSIGIIPYLSSNMANFYCYPMKLFEYFYMGKPVISTPIDELKQFDSYVKICESVKEWQNEIQYRLDHAWPTSNKSKQRSLAINNSWSQKIKGILEYI